MSYSTPIAHTVAQATSSGASVTTSAIDTTGADLIVVAVARYIGATVSDNKGNTYTAATGYGSDPVLTFYYCQAPTVGTGHTFSVGSVASGYAALAVAAFSGSGASPLDQQNGASGETAGSITPSASGELIISAYGGHNTAGPSAVSGMTLLDAAQFNNSTQVAYGIALGYAIQTTATAINPSWSGIALSVPGETSIVAAFSAAAGGGGTSLTIDFGGAVENLMSISADNALRIEHASAFRSDSATQTESGIALVTDNAPRAEILSAIRSDAGSVLNIIRALAVDAGIPAEILGAATVTTDGSLPLEFQAIARADSVSRSEIASSVAAYTAPGLELLRNLRRDDDHQIEIIGAVRGDVQSQLEVVSSVISSRTDAAVVLEVVGAVAQHSGHTLEIVANQRSETAPRSESLSILSLDGQFGSESLFAVKRDDLAKAESLLGVRLDSRAPIEALLITYAMKSDASIPLEIRVSFGNLHAIKLAGKVNRTIPVSGKVSRLIVLKGKI